MSGWSSSAHNARMIRDALLAAGLARQERAVLIGYSKGAPDILQALVEYPEIVGKVAAVVSVAGAVGGTPLTDSMGELEKKIMAKNPIVECPPGVGDPIASLQRSTRQLWLSQNRLPPSVRYFSLVTRRADIIGNRTDPLISISFLPCPWSLDASLPGTVRV